MDCGLNFAKTLHIFVKLSLETLKGGLWKANSEQGVRTSEASRPNSRRVERTNYERPAGRPNERPAERTTGRTTGPPNELPADLPNRNDRPTDRADEPLKQPLRREEWKAPIDINTHFKNQMQLILNCWPRKERPTSRHLEENTTYAPETIANKIINWVSHLWQGLKLFSFQILVDGFLRLPWCCNTVLFNWLENLALWPIRRKNWNNKRQTSMR